MNIIQEAFTRLCPEKEFKYKTSIKYSRKFKEYNSNVRLSKNKLSFRLSREWKKVDREIRIGLIQTLLAKLFKTKNKTIEMEYYDSFLKHIHLAIPKENVNPMLKNVFDKINDIYFNSLIEMPNLIIGNPTTSKLGSYEYGRDAITISSILLKNQALLEYVVFHEMLHKKYKFSSKAERTIHHPKEFRKEERRFPRAEELEKELSKLVRQEKRRGLFRIFG